VAGVGGGVGCNSRSEAKGRLSRSEDIPEVNKNLWSMLWLWAVALSLCCGLSEG